MIKPTNKKNNTTLRHRYTMATRPLWAVLLAMLIGLAGCGTTPRSEATCTPGKLRLALSEHIAGCSVVGGERYGFASDVLDSVALREGLKLTLTSGHSNEAIGELLSTHQVDVALIPVGDIIHFDHFPSELLYSSEYVLLMPSWAEPATGASIEQAWKGKRILTDCNFRHTEAHAKLLALGARCNEDHIDGLSKGRKLNEGRVHAIVCERSEAELLKFLYRNIVEVATIEEPCQVMMVFATEGLAQRIGRNLAAFATTEEYAYMVDLYFGQTSIGERFTQLLYRPTRVAEGISIWDEMLRRICSQYQIDWRLMSAMAYHESRFRNDQISDRGAVGLMQVTPIAAEDLNITGDYDLSDPTTNITLAARLLGRYSRALGFGPTPTTDDQMAILVASYNCGITRTIEAQRLAALLGGSAESWADVAGVLSNMANDDWRLENGCQCGQFADAPITIAYTNRVMELYATYRSAIE